MINNMIDFLEFYGIITLFVIGWFVSVSLMVVIVSLLSGSKSLWFWFKESVLEVLKEYSLSIFLAWVFIGLGSWIGYLVTHLGI